MEQSNTPQTVRPRALGKPVPLCVDGCIWVAVMMVAHVALADQPAKAPFTIPPSGESAQLVGGVDVPPPTAMAFDSRNRPYLINTRDPESFGKLWTLRDGQWIVRSFRDQLDPNVIPKKRHLQADGEMVIDDHDAIYLRLRGHLVYSDDLGETFDVYPSLGSIELRTGPNRFDHPPAIGQIADSSYVDRDAAKWAKRGTLSVLLPTKDETGLTLGEPILISNNCLAAGSGGHSGGTSFAVTVGRLTHVVYAQCPQNIVEGGNPIYIATLDRKTRQVIANRLLVNAPPTKADVHTRPTITADAAGYLHVLSGSHGQPFYYLRSAKPNDITSGWTDPIRLAGRQCYASLVCDQNNQLHTVFRQWLPHATLGYTSTEAKQAKWAANQTLVHGALERGRYQYGIFYHRLFIDRRSNLLLAFTFFEFRTGADGRYPQALAISKDAGRTWQLATTADFTSAVAPD